MRYLLAPILCLSSCMASANVIQYFTGISYSNPAELFKVKKNEFILGATPFYVDAKFQGSALNYNTFQYGLGESATKQTSILPYGRIASRLGEKLVFGVDITEPFHSNLAWGRNDVTRYAGTENFMTDVDVSPRVSLSLTPNVYVGGGLNFNFLKNNEVNWALPINQTESAILVNRTSGFGLGYNAGLYIMINATNFFGATYYSAIDQNTRGESSLAGAISHNIYFNFHFPATTTVNFTHIFNKDWLANLQVFRTQWNVNQAARIYNTAAHLPVPDDFIFPTKYQASLAFSGAIRRQVNEKVGLTLIGMVDYGPEQDKLRTILFPSDTQYFLALAADYHISKTTSVELLYGHGYSKTQIDNQISVGGQMIPFTTGNVVINADVVDLKLKVQMD